MMSHFSADESVLDVPSAPRTSVQPTNQPAVLLVEDDRALARMLGVAFLVGLALLGGIVWFAVKVLAN